MSCHAVSNVLVSTIYLSVCMSMHFKNVSSDCPTQPGDFCSIYQSVAHTARYTQHKRKLRVNIHKHSRIRFTNFKGAGGSLDRGRKITFHPISQFEFHSNWLIKLYPFVVLSVKKNNSVNRPKRSYTYMVYTDAKNPNFLYWNFKSTFQEDHAFYC